MKKLSVILFLILAIFGTSLFSQEKVRPFLHPLFSDNMVIQRDMIETPVWGWAKSGQKVTVELDGKKADANVDQDGKWLVNLPKLSAGGPFEMTIKSDDKNVALKNVMIGDVWICSGQSNMEQGIKISNNPEAEIAAANHENIRLFMVPHKIAYTPQELVESSWQKCTPENVGSNGWGGFSAVAYYFGRNLQESVKVPIGLIQTCWGGTVAEAWTSGEALSEMDDFNSNMDEFNKSVEKIKSGTYNFEKEREKWWTDNDPGTAKENSWMNPDADDNEWKIMALPNAWENAGLPSFDGIAWFRREFNLPEDWKENDAELHLGPIDDIDSTWVNGNFAGGLSNCNAPRDYKVPGKFLKKGRNVIAVRVLDTGGQGGILGQKAQMKFVSSGIELPLDGNWRYKVAAEFSKLAPLPARFDQNPNVVTVLFNGMIAPLLPFGIKGAIWYQGESNAGRAKQYQKLLPVMIIDWRNHFGAGQFPFLIVQLANFMAVQKAPAEGGWAYLREAQSMTVAKDPEAGLAVAIDIGDANDIHPKNKQDVGRRLALAAQSVAYNQPLVYSGPWFKSMEVKDDKAILSFDQIGGGLVTRNGEELKGFDIAGDDKKFYFAKAVIDGDTIIVRAPEVKKPVSVRYAWANNPICNLYSNEGLPAVPFRTDDWE